MATDRKMTPAEATQEVERVLAEHGYHLDQLTFWEIVGTRVGTYTLDSSALDRASRDTK